MQSVSRQQIFEQAAKKLRADFEELSVVPHALLKGNQAEALVKAFLKAHLPKRFAVGSGFIIDSRDQISKQTDVIIYDALNCPVYRASEDAAIIPADNVAAVIEVKANLDKERLTEAAENCRAVKNLVKTKNPFGKERDKEDGPSLSQTFFAVFGFQSALTSETLTSHYHRSIVDNGLGRHIDLMLLLDRSVSTLAIRMPETDSWSPAFIQGFPPNTEGTHISVGTHELGAASLDGFLRFLLPQLTFFREITGHPGFNWGAMGASNMARVQYLTTMTDEMDPVRRKEKLEKYAADVAAEFDAVGKKPT